MAGGLLLVLGGAIVVEILQLLLELLLDSLIDRLLLLQVDLLLHLLLLKFQLFSRGQIALEFHFVRQRHRVGLAQDLREVLERDSGIALNRKHDLHNVVSRA